MTDGCPVRHRHQREARFRGLVDQQTADERNDLGALGGTEGVQVNAIDAILIH